ncbi:S-adenosyl-L-methionine-dependent methyltransferase [Hypomontagnella submonticulosa]|nr:S-adenosyl-L-methionine-dependent methyltransferase [Hypomontagnella submonticulosa]
MSSSASSTKPFTAEQTFKAYTLEQGIEYAQARTGYHKNLYQLIVDHHTSTGGQLDTALDVGCGPGIAARGLAPHFAHVIGLDPSEGMIATARSLGGVSKSSEPIRFEVSTAEGLGSNLSPPIPNGSVDLITAATAAHWFDMSGFWPRAAQVLKPGGTVAVWTTSALYIHPSTPNYAAVQKALDEFKEHDIGPYRGEGNRLARELYLDLPLPWTLEQPVSDFDESTFFRKEWKRDNSDDSNPFGLGLRTSNLDAIEKRLGTGSPVTRWREAHPDAVGTERDVVRVLRRKIERLLHEAGVEEGKEVVTGGVESVLLMIKKKS